jgi:lysophospholipase
MNQQNKLVSIPENPVPDGVISGHFRSYDGLHLRYARWRSSTGETRGTVCIFNGRGEFIEKYFETVCDLRRRGFAVAIMDWRGQGGSGRLLGNPRKGHVEDFIDYERDIHRFMKEVVLPDCRPPFLGLGFSMGANVLLRMATLPDCWFRRITLVAPMLGLRVPLPLAFVRFASELVSIIGFSGAYVSLINGDMSWEQRGFKGNLLTSDEVRFRCNGAVIKAAPQLGLGNPTFGWLSAATRSMDMVNSENFAHLVQVPILLISSGNDKVVANEATQLLSTRLRICRHILVPGARHELLQEQNRMRELFFAAFYEYMH